MHTNSYTAFIWTLLLTINTSCNVADMAGTETQNGRGNGALSSNSTGGSCAANPDSDTTAEVPDVDANSGQLIVKVVESSYDPCALEGYLLNGSGKFPIQMSVPGTYYADQLVAGEYDLIVTSPALGGNKLANPHKIMIRLSNIRISNGEQVTKNIRLVKPGTLAGLAKLAGQKTHEGIEVQIPGTNFAAETDSEGKFKLSGVPAGTHNLTFSFKGYYSSRAEGVRVYAETTSNVDEAVLVTGVSDGAISLLDANDRIIPGALPTINSRTVRFVISTKSQPRLMKVSEDGNFANVDWRPFQSVGSYTFSKVGLETGGKTTKRLSIKTLDESIEGEYEKALVVDLFDDVRGKYVLKASNIGPNGKRDLKIFAQLDVPETAVEMRLATDPNFIGAVWMPARESAEIDIQSPDQYILYGQFRDRDLVTSDLYSVEVEVVLFPANSIRFEVPRSPLAYPSPPNFELENLVLPVAGNVEIKVSTVPDMTHATSYTQLTNLVFAPSDNPRLACGDHDIYLDVVYTPEGSDVAYSPEQPVTTTVSYTCGKRVPDANDRETISPFSVASGAHVLFFGGRRLNSNETVPPKIFNQATFTWSSISTIDAPSIDSWEERIGVATGSEFTFMGESRASGQDFVAARYNPATDTWTNFGEPSSAHPDFPDFDYNDVSYYGKAAFAADEDYVILYSTYYNTYAPNGYVYRVADQEWTYIPTHIPTAGSDTSYKHPTTEGSTNESAAPARCHADDDRPVAIYHNQQMFIWSGTDCDDTLQSGGYLYNVSSNTWQVITSENEPSPRTDHIVLGIGDKFFVAGGRTGNDADISDNLNKSGGIFDSSSNTWTTIPDAPFAIGRDVSEAAAINGKIVLYGGDSAGTRIWQGAVYDPATNQWAPLPSEKAFRAPPTGVNEHTVSFGEQGMCIVGNALNQEELRGNHILASCYSVRQNAWTPFPHFSNRFGSMPLPVERKKLRILHLNDGVMLFGGYVYDRDDYENYGHWNGIFFEIQK